MGALKVLKSRMFFASHICTLSSYVFKDHILMSLPRIDTIRKVYILMAKQNKFCEWDSNLHIMWVRGSIRVPTSSYQYKWILVRTTKAAQDIHQPRVDFEDEVSNHYRPTGIPGYAPLPNTLAARASSHASSLQDLQLQGTHRDPTYPHQGMGLAMVRFHHGNKMQACRLESRGNNQHPI